MGLLSAIFKKKNKNTNGSKFSSSGFPFFNPIFTGKVTKDMNVTFMNCVSSNARNFSKIIPYVTLKGEPTKTKGYLEHLLQFQPNERQNAAVFWQSVAWSYFYFNVALIYPERDIYGDVCALWPIDLGSTLTQFCESKDGQLAVKFFTNGSTMYELLKDLIVLERDVDTSGNFKGVSPEIDDTLKVLKTSYQGIVNLILSSNYIQYICSLSTNVTEDALKKRQDDMEKIWVNGNPHVLMVNGGQDLQRIEPKGTIPMAEQIQEFKNDLYQYESTNPAIVNSDYTEIQWQAYYEGCLEPLANQINQELTNKLLNIYEFNKGGRIQIQVTPLQTASLASRCNVINALKGILPMVVPNDILGLVYLPKMEGGDVPVKLTNLSVDQADNLNNDTTQKGKDVENKKEGTK